jgi:hypothetical protein
LRFELPLRIHLLESIPPFRVVHWVLHLGLHPVKINVHEVFLVLVLHILHPFGDVVVDVVSLTDRLHHGALGLNDGLIDLEDGRLHFSRGVESLRIFSRQLFIWRFMG